MPNKFSLKRLTKIRNAEVGMRSLVCYGANICFDGPEQPHRYFPASSAFMVPPGLYFTQLTPPHLPS